MGSPYLAEPDHRHGSEAKTGVLLVNLGTPEAPTAPALRRYLKEFLSDPRVVEIPRLVWWPILNGIILNTRPRQSAEKYAKVWTPEGSPLKVHTEKQAKLLRGYLGEAGHHLTVDWAMRYGTPSVADVLGRMKAQGCGRILVVPLYPQYAASATATVVDAVCAWLQKSRNQPEVRFVRSFHDHPGYIEALARSIRAYWQREGRPPDEGYRLVMSFHGLPRRSLSLGDPYFCECQKTGRLLAEALNLPADRHLVTFQSRFGRAEWLQPYTIPTLESLATQGVRRVDVVCPGFVADCLETLEEIGIEGKASFLSAGGEAYHYIPCLNESDDWLRALTNIVENHLAGWPTRTAANPTALATAAERARRLGAAS